MAKQRSFTAPLAIIKSGGVAIGKMKTIRITETIRRGRVIGIGNMTAQEIPPTEYTCNLSCSAYTIEFSDEFFPGSLDRKVNTVEDFINNVLLQEEGLELVILRRKRVAGSNNVELVNFATIKDLFINRESMDISEGQISGRDADFEYLTPILYPQ